LHDEASRLAIKAEIEEDAVKMSGYRGLEMPINEHIRVTPKSGSVIENELI